MSEAALLADGALPGLLAALDRAGAEDLLRPALERAVRQGIVPLPSPGRAWRVAGVEVLKHQAGRRCAVAFLLEDGGRQARLFGKLFATDRGARIGGTMERIAEALADAGVLVPRPLAYLPAARLLVTEYLEGRSLADALYAGRSVEPARRMARAIAALHRAEVAVARRWGPAREIAVTAERMLPLTTAGAARDAARARELLEGLERGARAVHEDGAAPVRPIHRDFYADQVWDCDGRTALLDLDDVRMGDPAVDAGNFLAHLTLRSVQFPAVAAGCRAARPEFLETHAGSGTSCPPLTTRRLRFYEAASLLRLSGVYASRERWRSWLPSLLLDAAGAVLEE